MFNIFFLSTLLSETKAEFRVFIGVIQMTIFSLRVNPINSEIHICSKRIINCIFFILTNSNKAIFRLISDLEAVRQSVVAVNVAADHYQYDPDGILPTPTLTPTLTPSGRRHFS